MIALTTVERAVATGVVVVCCTLALGPPGAIVGVVAGLGWWLVPPVYAVAIGAALGGVAGPAVPPAATVAWLAAGLAVPLLVEVRQEYTETAPLAVGTFAVLATLLVGVAGLTAAWVGLVPAAVVIVVVPVAVAYALHRYERVQLIHGGPASGG